jgi:uncharacterized RDD family membrane protein YckC
MTTPVTPATCPRCAQPLVEGALFCHSCGRQLQVRCSNCGAGNPEGSTFCHRCGTRLAVAAQPFASADATGAPAPPVAAPVARTQCPRCRAVNDPGSRFCFSCGLPLEGAAAGAGLPLVSPTGVAVGTPAGFWIRFLAIIIDGILLSIVGGIISAAMGQPVFGQPAPENPSFRDMFQYGPADGINFLIQTAYHVIGWSVYGTTVGKKLLGLYVVRPDGSRASFLRALGRYFAEALSFILLGIGYLMVAFRSDKRALHDLLADTYVVKK